MTNPDPVVASSPETGPILVVDFGAQYAQLIARRVREQNVYCEIVRHSITAERVRELAPIGIILSGGPASVYEEGAPDIDPALLRTSAVVFETVHPLPELRRAHVRIDLHTWSCERCSLPRGSTRATLQGHLPGLRAGEVGRLDQLFFGSESGSATTAGPSLRRLRALPVGHQVRVR